MKGIVINNYTRTMGRNWNYPWKIETYDHLVGGGSGRGRYIESHSDLPPCPIIITAVTSTWLQIGFTYPGGSRGKELQSKPETEVYKQTDLSLSCWNKISLMTKVDEIDRIYPRRHHGRCHPWGKDIFNTTPLENLNKSKSVLGLYQEVETSVNWFQIHSKAQKHL